MIRPVDDFKRAAGDRNIKAWTIRRCGLCGYPLSYLFHGEGVLFDPGCDCTYGGLPEPRSWDDVASHYNRNQPENNPRISETWLAEVDAFWGFEAAT